MHSFVAGSFGVEVELATFQNREKVLAWTLLRRRNLRLNFEDELLLQQVCLRIVDVYDRFPQLPSGDLLTNGKRDILI